MKRKVEVLHERDPDSWCNVRVWIDGKPVEISSYVDVDPGAGHSSEDWKAAATSHAQDGERSEAFRTAVAKAYDEADQTYIIEQEARGA